MKKLVFLLMLIIIIAIFSCDRFEHKFEPEIVEGNYIIDFFTTFADTIQSILPAANVSDVMDFYNDDYSNNGSIKADVEDFYESFYQVNMVLDFEASIIDTNGLSIDWRLLVTNPVSETTYMDTIISDVLIETEDSYMFYGNQADMRNVVVELLTGQWCSNCPNAEEALHNLKAQYGSRFSYVEYHVGDQLAGDFSDLLSYYPFQGTLPVAIINGNELIIYEAPDPETVQSAIDAAIQPLLQEDLMITLDHVVTTLTDTTLIGTVTIGASVAVDDLKLVAVLMEDYNNDYPNYHGDAHNNIVLKRSEIDISCLYLEDPVHFELSGLDELPAWYSELPQDLTLVLWVQKLESNYDEATCEIYNVIEIPIN